MINARARHHQYVKRIAWQQYINYSTIVVALACYLTILSDQWQAGAIFVLGTMLSLAGIMQLIRLRADQLLRMGKRAFSPNRLFP